MSEQIHGDNCRQGQQVVTSARVIWSQNQHVCHVCHVCQSCMFLRCVFFCGLHVFMRAGPVLFCQSFYIRSQSVSGELWILFISKCCIDVCIACADSVHWCQRIVYVSKSYGSVSPPKHWRSHTVSSSGRPRSHVSKLCEREEENSKSRLFPQLNLQTSVRVIILAFIKY